MVIYKVASDFNLLQFSPGTFEAEVSSVIQVESIVGGSKGLRICRFLVWISRATLVNMLLQLNAELSHRLLSARRGTVRAKKTNIYHFST